MTKLVKYYDEGCGLFVEKCPTEDVAIRATSGLSTIFIPVNQLPVLITMLKLISEEIAKS